MAAEHKSFQCECQDASTVFFSKDISSATLLKLYEKLGTPSSGPCSREIKHRRGRQQQLPQASIN